MKTLTNHESMSLNGVLCILKLSMNPARFLYQKDIVGEHGQILFTGDADQVWSWLRETGRIADE